MHVTQLKSYYTHYKLTFPAKPNHQTLTNAPLPFHIRSTLDEHTHTHASRNKSALIKKIHFLPLLFFVYLAIGPSRSTVPVHTHTIQNRILLSIRKYFMHAALSSGSECVEMANLYAFLRALVRFPFALVFCWAATYVCC